MMPIVTDEPTRQQTRQTEARLPDVALQQEPTISGRLDWVGMSGVEVLLPLHQNGQRLWLPGRADAYVSLDAADVKGIHMSRLFLALQNHLNSAELSVRLFDRILQDFLATHTGISRSAKIRLRFELPHRQSALLSDYSAIRLYPVSIAASQLPDRPMRLEVQLRLTYSSTCPCSAALSRQLIQQSFHQEFGERTSVAPGEIFDWLGTEEAICATPHAQRSHADLTLSYHPHTQSGHTVLDLGQTIEVLEATLATAVQAVVKRYDEQEFARRNGANLMFCEDAARRLKQTVEEMSEIDDYRIIVRHLESLHPHDAVSVVVRGVPGGLQPLETIT